MSDDLFSPQIYPVKENPPVSEQPAQPKVLEPEDRDLFTVSTLTEAIKQNLESNYRKVRVEGEVSNFKLHTSGHWYFSLKDRDAQISCALFRASAAKLKSPPKDGDRVIATGKISLFAPRGQYQLIATTLEMKGLGELLAELERLKVSLKEKGWFDKERKRALPSLPKVIGVVTSETGAALQDMINVLSHRNFSFHLLLYPVHVQGDVAASEIARAIDFFNREKLCDVMIVGRGGGAYEDLMAFNDIAVLTAIYNSQIPIISAVGHETDFTLSDFVADHRAPTPSAAAERVMASAKERAQQIQSLQKELLLRMAHQMQSLQRKVQRCAEHPCMREPFALIEEKWQALDYAKERIESRFTTLFAEKKMRLTSMKKALNLVDPKAVCSRQRALYTLFLRRFTSLSKTLFQPARSRLERAQARLDALSPKQVLKRGYTMTYSEGQPVTSAADLDLGQKVSFYFHDGNAQGVIDSIQLSSDITKKDTGAS